jgi:hypothetical protein
MKHVCDRALKDKGVLRRNKHGQSSIPDPDGHGVVLNPSIWLDGKQIEREGEYVEPTLADLRRQLTA